MKMVFMMQRSPYEVRFSSFADLVVWFYLRDPTSGVNLESLYGDHLNDTTGLSKIIFE